LIIALATVRAGLHDVVTSIVGSIVGDIRLVLGAPCLPAAFGTKSSISTRSNAIAYWRSNIERDARAADKNFIDEAVEQAETSAIRRSTSLLSAMAHVSMNLLRTPHRG
jgi:hypothetical protein